MHYLPQKVIFCKLCVQSNQRPGPSPEHLKKNKSVPTIGFKDGICDACRYYSEIKSKINWQLREKELKKLCDKYRDKNALYDVIVPGSGGKDSIYVSQLLKNKYKMKVLSVTWAPHLYTDIGWKNFQSWCKTGIDNILVTPNYKVHSKLTSLAFKKLVNPFQPFIMGQKVCAPKIALKYGVKLIFYGENNSEARGNYKENLSPIMDPKHFTRKNKKSKLFFGGVSMDDLQKKYGINKRDLDIYVPPLKKDVKKQKIEVHFMSYYKKWSPQENYYFAKKNSNFQANLDGRSEGTYSKFSSLDDKIDGQHYYTMYIKFGQGRAMNDACRDIRDGFITRDEALLLMKKYDGEFPKKYFSEFLNYININEKEYWKILNRARPNHLWKNKNGKWSLRKKIWDNND